MGRQAWLVLLLPILLGLGSGCSYKQRNVLYKYPQHREFFKAEVKKGKSIIKLKPDSTQRYEYRLRTDDAVTIQFINLPEDLLKKVADASGIMIAAGIPIGNSVSNNLQPTGQFNFVIDLNGEIPIPLIGRINARGKTLLQFRNELETLFSRFANDPKIEIRVTNLRVQVQGEVARPGVIFLPQERTHLTEVITLAGGIPISGKAQSVQIIRGDLKDPQIIWVNLQDIEALKSEDLIVHAGDIVYVEPRNLQLVSREAQPVLSLLGFFSFLLSIATLIVITSR
jgi:protein involved in polysaccharide export with SLBB domain